MQRFKTIKRKVLICIVNIMVVFVGAHRIHKKGRHSFLRKGIVVRISGFPSGFYHRNGWNRFVELN